MLIMAASAAFVLNHNAILGYNQMNNAIEILRDLSVNATDPDVRASTQTLYALLSDPSAEWRRNAAAVASQSQGTPLPSPIPTGEGSSTAAQHNSTKSGNKASSVATTESSSIGQELEVPGAEDPGAKGNRGGYDVRFQTISISNAPVMIVAGSARVEDSDVGNQNYYITSCYLAKNVSDKTVSLERFKLTFSSDLDGVLKIAYPTVRHDIEPATLDQPFKYGIVHSDTSECLRIINLFGDNVSKVTFTVDAVEYTDGTTWHAPRK